MIDLRQLRETPDRFKNGAKAKNIHVDIDRILTLDEQRRAMMTKIETLRAEQKKIEKDLGPQIG
jgi:seryl-tRNA synthetase